MVTTARRIVAGALLALSAMATPAQTWPGQTIRIIVPFTPGTGMDTIARTVAPRLSERLGQPVVVVNTPGASGNIGAEQVARAQADGYTVLMGANTMLMAAQLYRKVPFDPVRDFTSVSMAAWGTLMLVANPKTGITSMADLIARARAHPGQISYGSPGVGTPHHMAMELFKTRAGVFMLHVPYKGTAGYLQDLLGGELNVGFLPIHVAQSFVASGKLVALGVGSPKRNPAAPGVATLDELGLKDVNVDIWYAFFVPARTAAPVVNRLHAELEAILELPDVRGVLARSGLDAAASTPAQLADIVGKDYRRWGSVIRRNGITAE
ncbi:MAG: tripartite tricarboxylate transporter substrate binding protein [Variovorax sp.]